MKSVFVLLGAFAAGIGVAMGAFGAHALKGSLSPEALAIYHTAVNYQMWHALGLLCIGLIQQQMPESKKISWAGWLMFSGIVLFSGSLYTLAITDLRWLGMITPVGGGCFLIAWILTCLTYTKKTTRRYH